ncbi:MAG: hypothetical protein ABI680_19370 [Chthoniobacteraceae bacterium]
MIPVSLSVLVYIYLGGMLSLIFVAWGASEWQRRRRERSAFLNVLKCPLCGCVFKNESTVLLPECPRCGDLNERRSLSRL